nr:MAG TPA: hypothetical protein [Caudoviricetes sp.]
MSKKSTLYLHFVYHHSSPVLPPLTIVCIY